MLTNRGAVHGDFNEQSVISQALKRIIANSKNWGNMMPAMREGLDMIVHKISRICTGDANHKDHWIDVAGYAIKVMETTEHNQTQNQNMLGSLPHFHPRIKDENPDWENQ